MGAAPDYSSVYQYTYISDSALAVWYQLIEDQCSALTLPTDQATRAAEYMLHQASDSNDSRAHMSVSSVKECMNAHAEVTSACRRLLLVLLLLYCNT